MEKSILIKYIEFNNINLHYGDCSKENFGYIKYDEDFNHINNQIQILKSDEVFNKVLENEKSLKKIKDLHQNIPEAFITKNIKAIDASIKKHQKALIKISDEIWKNAELALEEHKSSKILADYPEKNAFSLERGVAGMPTAFIASYGSGRP